MTLPHVQVVWVSSRKKTMCRQKTDCPASGKIALSNTGKISRLLHLHWCSKWKLPKTPHLNNMSSHEWDMMNMGILQGVILWYDTLASGTLIREKLMRVTFKSTTEWEQGPSLYTNSIAHTWLMSLIPKCGQEWKTLFWHSKRPTGLKWDQFWKQLLSSYATRLRCGKWSQYRKRQESSWKF